MLFFFISCIFLIFSTNLNFLRLLPFLVHRQPVGTAAAAGCRVYSFSYLPCYYFPPLHPSMTTRFVRRGYFSPLFFFLFPVFKLCPDFPLNCRPCSGMCLYMAVVSDAHSAFIIVTFSSFYSRDLAWLWRWLYFSGAKIDFQLSFVFRLLLSQIESPD